MVTFADVEAARARIAGGVRRTPVLSDPGLDARAGAQLYFKCENLQRAGAFKMRGALNAVLSLDEADARRGVATHSSGNHGTALATAAAIRGIPAYIVVPRNARLAKRQAIAAAGAEIVECEPTLAARETTLAAVVARTGAHFVPPYDDDRVIAGQGTAALELIEDVPDLDEVWVPVGGGGLASGTVVAISGAAPQVQVVGAEPAGADDAYRSLRDGTLVPQTDPRTVADGLLTSLGQRNFAILSGYRLPIRLASDAGIMAAARELIEMLHVVTEPSSAVPWAALLESDPAGRAGRRIGVILTGGNLGLDDLVAIARPRQ